MKTHFILLFLLIAAASNYPQKLQGKIKPDQFFVTGTVEIKQAADEASFYFTVKGFGESLRKAVEDAEKSTREITDKLMALGIKRTDIQTSDFMSGANPGGSSFLSSSKDYKASITTKIKTDSLELLKSMIFIISEANVESLSDISFSYSKITDLKRKARTEAVLKAKEKAEDMVGALGVKLGKVLNIEEYQNPSPFSVNPMSNITLYAAVNEDMNRTDASIGSGFFSQIITVTSSIKVTYALE